MNMDRNTIRGASAGMVFKDPRHWDAWDRFQSVEQQAQSSMEASARALAGSGAGVALYNPLNWKRDDPVKLKLPSGSVLDGARCESLPGGTDSVLCRLELNAGRNRFCPSQAPGRSGSRGYRARRRCRDALLRGASRSYDARGCMGGSPSEPRTGGDGGWPHLRRRDSSSQAEACATGGGLRARRRAGGLPHFGAAAPRGFGPCPAEK
jgi:hypothetical protein